MVGLFRREPAPSRDCVTVHHAGEILRVAIKRVRGARRYTLRVRAATRDVVLSMPSRGSYDSARAFAEKHAAWIRTRLDRLPQMVPFALGEALPLRGVDHVIVPSASRGAVWTEAPVPPDPRPRLCVGGEPAFAARRVHDYLRREARRDLENAVRSHSERIGKQARRVTLRDTTSRWGSCSAEGCLSFSWRLILAPPFVLDYLAAHETAHLAHMNHSASFWKLARKLSPDADRAEAWLKAHGASLHRYGERAVRRNVR